MNKRCDELNVGDIVIAVPDQILSNAIHITGYNWEIDYTVVEILEDKKRIAITWSSVNKILGLKIIKCSYHKDVLFTIKESKAAEVIDNSSYPHVCPRCNGPAYIGLLSIDCKNKC